MTITARIDECMMLRVARKRHRCVNAHAADRGNPAVANICTRWIEPGQSYVVGEIDPYYAGGFGHEFICKPCADAGV